MRLPFLTHLPIAVLLVACEGGGGSIPGGGDAGAATSSGAAATTSVGSGTIEGTGGFAVVTARWNDPGPFRERARLEVILSNDPACGRTGCVTFQQLFLRVTALPGAPVGPGLYSVSTEPDAGAAGSLEARTEYGERTTSGCSGGSQPDRSGTVTLETVTDTEVKGTYEVKISARDGSEPVLTGRFEARRCP